jgi:hypothetical protein
LESVRMFKIKAAVDIRRSEFQPSDSTVEPAIPVCPRPGLFFAIITYNVGWWKIVYICQLEL